MSQDHNNIISDDVRIYIDRQFDTINSNMKWATGIMVTVLIVLLGWIGTSTMKNRMYIKDMEFDIVILNGRTKALEYRILWISEINELVRDYYKGISNDETTKEILNGMQRMEDRINAEKSPMPTLRSGFYKDDE